MAPPIWNPGQVLLSSDVNNWFVPQVAVKTADQSRTSNTTLAADSELVLSNLAVGATYFFVCILLYTGGTGGASDIKWQWSASASASLRYHAIYTGAGGASNTGNSFSQLDVVAGRTQGAGVNCGVTMIGSYTQGAFSAALSLTWAQNTSSATATILNKQSILYCVRVS